MKNTFKDITAFMEKRLEERPRGYDLFAKEMSATIFRAFDENTRTAYVSGYAFPTELLWAFNVVPFDFEIACNNLPAAASGNGSSIMIHSENEGYSRDICSFDRLIVGCMLQGMLPKGDLYLTSSYYCHGKAKANEIVAASEGKESVLFDVPNEISASSIQYVTSQLKDIAARLEGITGESLDLDRLREAISWSNRARTILLEINTLMKHKPCPWDGARACLLALGGAIFWGSPVLHEINKMILQEIQERINSGKLFPESYRILWIPWVPVQTTNIFTTLRENNASVVMAEVANVWWSEIDESNPLEALALKALENLHVGRAEKRVKAIVKLAEDYDVDGVIHFATPACYHENGSLRLISDALKERGIPLLNLEGDMTDERNYSPEQTLNKLNTFLEIIGR
jgi:benzoyl-CoA reductase/2-hydroxyglutaryl-CoA dehydratase subunit BcrC/BadD/HgdB